LDRAADSCSLCIKGEAGRRRSSLDYPIVIRPALVLLAASLGGCATYSVQPFFDEGAKQVICCKAVVTNSKNIATVNFFATESNGVYVIRFAETGVNAAAPINSHPNKAPP
jgi:hypothetical protein